MCNSSIGITIYYTLNYSLIVDCTSSYKTPIHLWYILYMVDSGLYETSTFLYSLLLRRECCSFSNGEFLKAGLQELEQWCSRTTEEYAGASWDELQHIRQAVVFLVLHQKSHKTLEEITNELCPVLSITQIYRIATMFWDDKYGAQGLSQEVSVYLHCLACMQS